MRTALLALVLAGGAYAAVEGTVVNGTTGKAQSNAEVSLLKLGGAGMEPVGSVKADAQGRFRIESSEPGPQLLQAVHDGVTYNQMLTPGSPTTGVTLEVFDASAKAGAAKVSQHMVVLEPGDSQLAVSESVIFQNGGKLSFNDAENGTLRVYLPEGANQTRVSATAPHGVPLERTADKTNEHNVYKIDFPIKPGETRIDVSYVVPFTNPGTFRGKVLQRDTPVRLVVPPGVSLKGAGLQSLGQEPQTKAAIYGVKGREYSVEIQGTGTLRGGQQEAGDDSGSSLDQILPKVYDKVYWIVGLGLAVLFAGFLLLYRSSTNQTTAATPLAAASKDKRRS